MKNCFFVLLTALFFGLCGFFGCKPQAKSGAEIQPAKVVNLAIWANYLSPELQKEFEKETGIKIEISNYASNEELLAKIQAGAATYDVAVPSDYMVFAMTQLGMLHELDKTKVPNASDVDPKTTGKYFDPKNTYSLPWAWGTTGIAVNRKLYKGKVAGWQDVFENKALVGKFTLLDDVRETVGAALKSQNLSLNSKDAAELAKAKQVLVKAKKSVKGFTSDPQPALVNGEMVVAHAYSSDALQANKKLGGAGVEYVIPQEGCTFWIDNLVVLKNAPHLEAAHQLVNFLMSTKVGVARTEEIFAAPSTKSAIAALPEKLRKDATMFPSSEKLKKCEMVQDLGEELAQWDRIWTEVKAGSGQE